ncbi:DNA cytosine methyltransferase [Marinomonas lutimaris]|uniref:DNA cytosine methyltransferase n=1 Tax=Marinomonas lutimaris TaxID=2846746 RepID=UPI001CA5660B|nr:DNA cytosine methyltransferase [Marinomonas lutimaris]
MNSIEIFSGAGGLALGLKKSGFEHKAIIEINKDACKTIRSNKIFHFGKNLFEGSISDFNFMTISEEIDLLSGGPPCQPFSLGGKSKGRHDIRDMFPEAVRAIRESKPKAFIFENVKGLMRASFNDYFEYILLQLKHPSIKREDSENWERHKIKLLENEKINGDNSLEYNVIYKLVNAADYGIPQKRERVFFIGFRSDININWRFPEPTHSEDTLIWEKWISKEYWLRHKIPIPQVDEKNKSKAEKINKKYAYIKPTKKAWLTVRDTISDLPYPTDSQVKRVNDHIFKGGAKIYPGHTGSYIDEPAKALKAGDHGVPGGENMIRYQDGSVRYFTVRESARFQTFPDDFTFEGSWGEAMRQLGNAVPVKLAEIIGKSIFKSLSELKNDSKSLIRQDGDDI